jgi:ActR/RegA family two-component response regulator
MRILLLEDEDSIRLALARALGRDGAEIAAAASLDEARRIAAGFRPQILVTDLKLPDGLGLDLAAELAVPSVVLSGYATFDDAVRALRLGCVDLLTKPAALADVRAAVRRAGERLAPATASWSDPAAGRLAWDALRPHLPDRRSRLIAAELIQAAPSGSLWVRTDRERLVFWLDAALDWSGQADRTAWLGLVASGLRLAGDHARAVCALAAAQPHQPPRPSDLGGEILWPQELASETAIDAEALAEAGSWLAGWLRQHPGAALRGLPAPIHDRLAALGIVVRQAPAALSSVGVTSDERLGLWADDPPDDQPPATLAGNGPPLA